MFATSLTTSFWLPSHPMAARLVATPRHPTLIRCLNTPKTDAGASSRHQRCEAKPSWHSTLALDWEKSGPPTQRQPPSAALVLAHGSPFSRSAAHRAQPKLPCLLSTPVDALLALFHRNATKRNCLSSMLIRTAAATLRELRKWAGNAHSAPEQACGLRYQILESQCLDLRYLTRHAGHAPMASYLRRRPIRMGPTKVN